MAFSFNPQSEIPNPQLLRLFVYGTLKRGFWNHDRFCRGVLTVEDAMVRGRLFETSSGIPVLEVPEEDILAVGTTNPLADVATCLRADTHRQSQARVTARLFNPQSTIINPQYEGAPWGPVYGELLTFDDPEDRLPAIDRLEGFTPAVPASTAASWSLSRSTEPIFPLGSMWVKTRSRAGLRLSVGPAGTGSLDSVTLGQITQ